MSALCCARPNLHMGWKIGVDHSDGGAVIEFSDIECTNCGADWLLDNRSGSRCPMLSMAADRRSGVLSVKHSKLKPA